jgi:hypothetical protein
VGDRLGNGWLVGAPRAYCRERTTGYDPLSRAVIFEEQTWPEPPLSANCRRLLVAWGL